MSRDFADLYCALIGLDQICIVMLCCSFVGTSLSHGLLFKNESWSPFPFRPSTQFLFRSVRKLEGRPQSVQPFWPLNQTSIHYNFVSLFFSLIYLKIKIINVFDQRAHCSSLSLPSTFLGCLLSTFTNHNRIHSLPLCVNVSVPMQQV